MATGYQKRWYVIDHENATSWSEKTEAAQFFLSESAAKARAREIAKVTPGQSVFVCETTCAIICEVGKPVILTAIRVGARKRSLRRKKKS